MKQAITPAAATVPAGEAPSLSSQSSPSLIATEPDACYHRCLPLLLQHFQHEIGTKHLSEIAQKLQLLPKQLEEWLRRAIEEGKLAKKKKKGRVVYVASYADAHQTLSDRDGGAA